MLLDPIEPRRRRPVRERPFRTGRSFRTLVRLNSRIVYQILIRQDPPQLPAQGLDKINENFFRTTFTSRCLDVLPMFYSFETEYNSSEGRCDFLAIPKSGVSKPAQLVEFKYFTNAAAEKGNALGRATPDAETVKQALAYRKALARRPDWNHEIAATVVEVCGSAGYNWFDL